MEGTKNYRPGFTDQFSIQIKAPQGIRGIHPLTIAVRLNLALHEIMAHDFPGVERASIRCGVMRAGLAANSLPEAAWLKGVLSAASPDARAVLHARAEEITAATAAAFRASAVVSWNET